MLKLLKEAEKESRNRQEVIQREKNLAWMEQLKKIENKEDFNRFLLCGENVRQDLQLANQAAKNKLCKENIILCENSLARELREMKLDREREQKLRQLLWESAPELQELRKMFLRAGVARDQAMQLAQKEASRQLKKQEDECLAEHMARQKEAAEAEARRREEEEAKARRRYHQELDDLRRYKRVQEKSKDGDIEQERAAIDEMKKAIEEEDLKLAREKIEKREELRRQMVEQETLRHTLRLQEKLRDGLEAQKSDEFRRAQELRAREQAERRQLEALQRVLLQEELLRQLEAICRDKLEREELRTELAIEEREASDQQKTAQEEAQKRRIREDLQRVYDMQLCLKKQREDLERKEDEVFRQRMMSRLYEEDRLELMGQQKRRLMQLQHKRAVEEALKQNRQMKAEEEAKEAANQKYQEGLAEERRRMIEEERICFLRENAAELLGYLPKGTLRDTRTIDRVGGPVKNFYTSGHCKC